jgi:hypothetical protein
MASRTERYGEDEDSCPAIPPKATARNTIMTDLVQPPPKHAQHSEADVDARLGIVHRRPVPPPPEEDNLATAQQIQLTQMNLPEATGVAAVSNSCRSDAAVSKAESTVPVQSQGVVSAELASDNLSQNVALGSKAVKTIPVAAPRSVMRKPTPSEIVTDNTGSSCSSKKNTVALPSKNGQEACPADSVLTRPKPPVPKKFDASRHNTVSGEQYTSNSASSSAVRATMTVAMAANSQDSSISAEKHPTGSEAEDHANILIRRQLKVPGKLKVDGFLADRITVAMKQRPSILTAVTQLTNANEVSTASETTNVPLSSTARTYVESIKAFKNKSSAPMSPRW